MLEIQIDDVSNFKKLVECVKDLVDVAPIVCTPEKLKLQSADSTHIGFMKFCLRAKTFQRYECDKTYTLCISFVQLHRILKTVADNEIVTLKYKNLLHVIVSSSDAYRVTEYKLKPFSTTAGDAMVPKKFNYDAIVKIGSSEVQRVVRDLSALSEEITIGVKGSRLKFSTQNELTSASTVFDSTGGTVEVDAKRSMRIKLSSKYLSIFMRAAALSDSVQLSMNSGTPFRLEYKMNEENKIVFLLAPRISDEDSESDEEEQVKRKKVE